MSGGNQNAAKVYAIMGATGCGKSHYMRQMIARPKRRRTVIWSPKEPIDQYAGLYAGSVVVTTGAELRDVMRAAGRGEVHAVFRPPVNRQAAEKHFDSACRIAMMARDVTFIADELHTVTKPSWAPDGWSELIMMGRGYGAEVFGLSQRPASVDKDFFSNCSMVHFGRMSFDADAKAAASALRVKPAEVMALTGHQWLERNVITGELKRGG